MSLNVHRKSILLPMQTHPACSTFFKSLRNNSPGTILLPDIPEYYETLIRYYGYYANAARGKRKKLGLEIQLPLNIIDDAPGGRACRKSWAKLIYQVYEVDPLKCPKCGAQMKIIAFIPEREDIIRILKHLSMWPITYPEKITVSARASPYYYGQLQKLSASRHLK